VAARTPVDDIDSVWSVSSNQPLTDRPTFAIEPQTWAAAVDGDRAALERCLEVDTDGSLARGQRLASSLALCASSLGLEAPAWRARLRQVAAHGMHLEEVLEQTGRVLEGAGVRWVPIKGLDLGLRVYGRPEQRPTSDVDVLIGSRDLDVAQRALLDAGWTPLSSGSRVGRYLREEGYAWQARSPGGTLIEVHYRLWGSVATEGGDLMLDAAEPSADGERLRLADGYVLAAHHLWLDAAPRRVGAVRDLVMISRASQRSKGQGLLERSGASPAPNRSMDSGDLVEEVVASAGRLDLQLPVASAARWSAELWGHEACRSIAGELERELSRPERWCWSRQADLASASFPAMTLARQLSGRETRHGLARLVWRRLWAHPGIVEAAFDGDTRPFWVKRLDSIKRTLIRS